MEIVLFVVLVIFLLFELIMLLLSIWVIEKNAVFVHGLRTHVAFIAIMFGLCNATSILVVIYGIDTLLQRSSARKGAGQGIVA